MELRVYIIGKVTGEDRTICEAKFAAAEKKLRALGVKTVINPLKLGIPTTWTYEQEMDLCLQVVREQANAIFLIPDWVNSDGAMREWHHAFNHNYQIYDENDDEKIVGYLKHSGKWVDTSAHEHP